MTATAAFLLTYGITLIAALAALGLDALGKRRAGSLVAAAGLVASAAAGIAIGIAHPAGWPFGSIEVGGPASLVYGIIALTGAAAVAGSLGSEGPGSGATVSGLVALGVASGGAAAACTDLVTLLLVMESLAIVSYALVASARTARSGEAAMKYFVQGAVATGLFLFGLAVFLGVFAPSGKYATLTQVLVAPEPLFSAFAAAGLVLVFLTFKMGAFPFHSWAPDAYETAPAGAAAFLASGAKLAAIAAAGVFVSIVSAGRMGPRLAVVTLVLAMLSIVVGSVAALAQRDYRRLLGYAGVAQVGYALIAVALSNTPLAVFFGTTYAVATVGTFLAASDFARLEPEWDGSVAGLAGMGRRAPLLSGSVAVLLISLAGVPPFFGFWGKLLVFGTGLSYAEQALAQTPVLAGLAASAVAVGIVGAIVSLGFYGSILKSLYFDAPERPRPADESDSGETVVRSLGSAGAVVVLAAAAVTVLGLLPLFAGSTAVFDLFMTR